MEMFVYLSDLGYQHTISPTKCSLVRNKIMYSTTYNS